MRTKIDWFESGPLSPANTWIEPLAIDVGVNPAPKTPGAALMVSVGNKNFGGLTMNKGVENEVEKSGIEGMDRNYPRWMRLKEASWYSSIGQKRLKDIAEQGFIIGFKDEDSGRGVWIFDRYSLDAYRDSQAATKQYSSEKALGILRSAGVS